MTRRATRIGLVEIASCAVELFGEEGARRLIYKIQERAHARELRVATDKIAAIGLELKQIEGFPPRWFELSQQFTEACAAADKASASWAAFLERGRDCAAAVVTTAMTKTEKGDDEDAES